MISFLKFVVKKTLSIFIVFSVIFTAISCVSISPSSEIVVSTENIEKAFLDSLYASAECTEMVLAKCVDVAADCIPTLCNAATKTFIEPMRNSSVLSLAEIRIQAPDMSAWKSWTLDTSVWKQKVGNALARILSN